MILRTAFLAKPAHLILLGSPMSLGQLASWLVAGWSRMASFTGWMEAVCRVPWFSAIWVHIHQQASLGPLTNWSQGSQDTKSKSCQAIWVWSSQCGTWLFLSFSGTQKGNSLRNDSWAWERVESTCRPWRASQVVLMIKNPPANTIDEKDAGSVPGWRRSPGRGHGNPLQVLAWKIPRTKEPGGLQSIGSQRVRRDWSDLAHMDPGNHWNGAKVESRAVTIFTLDLCIS